MRIGILTLCLLCFAICASGQDTPEHPIDIELSNCLAENETTLSMLQCYDVAYQKWDAELNKAYKEAMKVLSPEGKKLLKSAQLKWLSWRDEEVKLMGQMQIQLEGTMYKPMMADKRLTMVRQRTLQLQDHA
jgi:uncharacterized protein YecT (DUF1311 family)